MGCGVLMKGISSHMAEPIGVGSQTINSVPIPIVSRQKLKQFCASFLLGSLIAKLAPYQTE